MIPALVNEGVTLIKDSSLVSAIGMAELALAHARWPGAYSALLGTLSGDIGPSTSC